MPLAQLAVVYVSCYGTWQLDDSLSRRVGGLIMLAGDLVCNTESPMTLCLLYGPDWPMNLCTHALIIGPFLLFQYGALAKYGLFMHLLSYTLLGATLVCLFIVSSQDPGVVAEPRSRDALESPMPEGATLSEGSVCSKCRIWKPRGMEIQHCNTCQVCIWGYDHHCPWMGKCIGGRTAKAFYGFLICVFSLLALVIFAVIAVPRHPRVKHP